MNNDREIKVPLDDWVRQIAQEAGKTAAWQVLRQHQEHCPVDELKTEIWGNGKPGLKAEMQKLKMNMEQARKQQGWWRDIAQSVITAAAIGLMWFLMSSYKKW